MNPACFSKLISSENTGIMAIIREWPDEENRKTPEDLYEVIRSLSETIKPMPER